MTHDVIVLGGGLTGLVAAYEMQKRGVRVFLLEERSSPGGNLRTYEGETPDGEWLLDLGPQTFGDAQPAMAALVEDLGIGARLLRAEGFPDRRFLWLDGKLEEVPTSPAEFLKSSVLPIAARMRVMGEPFVPALPAGAPEETLAAFCDRRFGEAVRRRIVTPVVGGIYAGDPEKLGAESAFPKVVALEREYGSLLNAMSRGGAPSGRGRLVTFDEGMQLLPEVLADRMGAAVRLEAAVEHVTQRDGVWVVQMRSGEEVAARRVVVTLPAYRAAAVIEPSAPRAAELLREIHHAPVAVVHIGFADTGLHGVPQGFGFLVPRDQGLRILGCIFSSRLFAGRAPGGCTLFTVFVGGDLDPDALAMEDEALQDLVTRDLALAFGCRLQATLFAATRWPHAIPQYFVGHGRRLAEIDGATPPGLHLLGNWRGGIAMEDCVREAKGFAERL